VGAPGAKYCDECVELFVCLSDCPFALIAQNPHGHTSPNFLCTLSAAVARSFCGGVAVCYVLPVLWMTSRFHVRCIPTCQ